MLADIVEAVRRLVRTLPEGVTRRLALGAVKAAERGGDVAYIYHEASKLAPDYYGHGLPYSESSEYWKVYGGGCIKLPEPIKASGVDALAAIRSRRSRREYSGEPLGLAELSSILYYSVGVTGKAWWGGPKRAYPSAGALQPIEAYVYAGMVEGVARGIYHYNPGSHCLEPIKMGDYTRPLWEAGLGQEHLRSAPAIIILTAVYPRTAWKYGLRAYRYVHWDAGFAGENIYIACEALGLATVAVGAFYDEAVCRLLEIDCDNEIPMLLFPVGKRPAESK